MIIEETINGLLFQEQRTYRIYKPGRKFVLQTSDEKRFLANKHLAKQKQKDGDHNNKFIVL